jgi:hypothetical protein
MRPKLSMYVVNSKVDTIAQFKSSLRPTHVNTTGLDIPDSAYVSNSSCPYTIAPTMNKTGLLNYSNMHVPGRQDNSTWNRCALRPPSGSCLQSAGRGLPPEAVALLLRCCGHLSSCWRRCMLQVLLGHPVRGGPGHVRRPRVPLRPAQPAGGPPLPLLRGSSQLRASAGQGQSCARLVSACRRPAGTQNNATLFAGEWRRFWRDLVRLPTYSKYLDGRVFPELANVRVRECTAAVQWGSRCAQVAKLEADRGPDLPGLPD